MRKPDFTDLDLDIAVARTILSALAIVSVYIDPTTAGGMFHLEPLALSVLLGHFVYSIAVYLVLRGKREICSLPAGTAVLDLFFATAVAFVTEGLTSPSYVFFVFAIIAVAVRGGLRATMVITTCCVLAYLGVTGIARGILVLHLMRAVYLAMAGLLGGFLGWQRAVFERRVRELEARAERESIARSLHDGYVQALAGISLRLQSCKELLSSDRSSELESELDGLRLGVQREYETVRQYLRSLAGAVPTAASHPKSTDPQLRFGADFEVKAALGEEILNIMLEALRNSRRHAAAGRITIAARGADGLIAITIHDDGVGFPAAAAPPWTIASRVSDLGGTVSLSSNGAPCIEVEIPTS